MFDLVKLMPLLAGLVTACHATPQRSQPPPQQPPTAQPVVAPAVVKPTPPPDPAEQRRIADKERLSLLTMAPTRSDLDILQRLSGIGCVNLLHNSNHRASSCARGLRRACPPTNPDGPETEALARSSWSLLNRMTVAIGHPRSWAAAQRCAAQLVDAKQVATLTLLQARRLSTAKQYQSLLACLDQCRLSTASKTIIEQLEGGRGTAERIEGRLAEAERLSKTSNTLEDAAAVFTSLDGTRKVLAARKAVDAATRTEFTKRMNVVATALKSAAPKLAQAAMAARIKLLREALVGARKLLRATDVTTNIDADKPRFDDMLSSAKELVVDVERISGKQLAKPVAAYLRRLALLEKKWQPLQPRLIKRAEQIRDGETAMSAACSLRRKLRDVKRGGTAKRKLQKQYQLNRRKLRNLRIRFRPKKDCTQ